MYICVAHACSAHGSQKRALDPVELEVPRRSWELNLDPLEEQPVVLTAEPSLQPHSTHLKVVVVRKTPEFGDWVIFMLP